NPIGANFIGANMAKEAFLKNSQMDWNNLYRANFGPSDQGKAAYVLYDDTMGDRLLAANTTGNLFLTDQFKIDFGIDYRSLASDNYAKIDDLLGAGYHEDIDPFSDTKNDLEGAVKKGTGDIFNYRYEIDVEALDAFV